MPAFFLKPLEPESAVVKVSSGSSEDRAHARPDESFGGDAIDATAAARRTGHRAPMSFVSAVSLFRPERVF